MFSCVVESPGVICLGLVGIAQFTFKVPFGRWLLKCKIRAGHRSWLWWVLLVPSKKRYSGQSQVRGTPHTGRMKSYLDRIPKSLWNVAPPSYFTLRCFALPGSPKREDGEVVCVRQGNICSCVSCISDLGLSCFIYSYDLQVIQFGQRGLGFLPTGPHALH